MPAVIGRQQVQPVEKACFLERENVQVAREREGQAWHESRENSRKARKGGRRKEE